MDTLWSAGCVVVVGRDVGPGGAAWVEGSRFAAGWSSVLRWAQPSSQTSGMPAPPQGCTPQGCTTPNYISIPKRTCPVHIPLCCCIIATHAAACAPASAAAAAAAPRSAGRPLWGQHHLPAHLGCCQTKHLVLACAQVDADWRSACCCALTPLRGHLSSRRWRASTSGRVACTVPCSARIGRGGH